jgi:hypothetical protein
LTGREPEEPAPRDNAEQDGIDKQELKRRYYERLSDWSEPGEIKINRNGKLLSLPSDSGQDSLIVSAGSAPWSHDTGGAYSSEIQK